MPGAPLPPRSANAHDELTVTAGASFHIAAKVVNAAGLDSTAITSLGALPGCRTRSNVLPSTTMARVVTQLVARRSSPPRSEPHCVFLTERKASTSLGY